MAWSRPADTVLCVSCTQGATLGSKVVEEESDRLGLKVKVQEGAGVASRECGDQ